MNKSYRLKANYEIEQLVHQKQSVGNIYYAVYYQAIEQEKCKIAISVSKKLGDAVTRNHEKRIIREILRAQIDNLKGYKYLIVEKKVSLELSYLEKEKQLIYLINKIKNRRRNEKL